MESGVLQLLGDYGGLLVGVALLLAAVSVLPGRIRWYVLTAGLAVIGYEAYMRTMNRKLLKEADAERARLRNELAGLDGRRLELEQRVATLNKQLAELNGKSVELQRQKAALEQSGDELAARRQQLDAESEKLIAESRALLQQSSESESMLAKLKEAKDAVEQMDKVVP